MAAKAGNKKSGVEKGLGESGQSLLEFLFMLPVMVGLIIIMVRVNSAIQISIVNQKYSRAQALFLTYSSAYYPRRQLVADNFIASGYNRMVIGVADKPISETDNRAEASTQIVVRDRAGVAGDGPSGQEPAERAVVRVRTTVALCTQTVALGPGIAATAENIGEKSVFSFCSGQDEGGG